MLDQIARHGNIDLAIECKGDLEIDEHHSIEDTGIALGEAIAKALGDKRGIERYGFLLPMDDCLAQVAIDFGGRNWIVWDAEFKREKIGEMPTEMFFHFLKSFSDASKSNLNIKAEGENEHHPHQQSATSTEMGYRKLSLGISPARSMRSRPTVRRSGRSKPTAPPSLPPPSSPTRPPHASPSTPKPIRSKWSSVTRRLAGRASSCQCARLNA